MAALAVVVAALLICPGCSVDSMPSYAQVRDETLEVLQKVTDAVPGPKEVSETPEFDPYPCGDKLAFGSQPGMFYTGQWLIYVADDVDVLAFIESVPKLLGDGWREDPLGIPVTFAQIRMVRDSPRISLTVEESLPRERKAVRLLAISRCGVEEPAS